MGGRGAGGRGVAVGGGRGGGRGPWTPQQQEWFAAGKCLRCGSEDHYAAACPRAGEQAAGNV